MKQTKQTLLLLAIVLALVGGVIAASASAWTSMGAVSMSGSGWAALIIGIFFTIVVGCGLMVLVFYSSRYGVDESAGRRQGSSDPQHHES